MDPMIVGAAALERAMDPTAKESAKVGGDLTRNLFSPLTQAIGDGWADAYRRANVERVAKRAAKKSAANGKSTGSIPPRVASKVFEEAQYADNAFVAEYLSGVLASSQTEGGTDDRGVTWTSLVGRLSSEQIRLHFILYREFRRLALGAPYEAMTEWENKPILVPMWSICSALGVGDITQLLESVYPLYDEDIIKHVGHGGHDYLNKSRHGVYDIPDGPGDWLMYAPTTRGMALYLEAHGLGGNWLTPLLDTNISFEIDWEESAEPEHIAGAWLESFKKA